MKPAVHILTCTAGLFCFPPTLCAGAHNSARRTGQRSLCGSLRLAWFRLRYAPTSLLSASEQDIGCFSLNIMRILILGAGKMGSFFTDILSFQHETAVFDVNPHQLRFVYNTYRFTTLEEIKEFEPELVINAATVKYTLDAFRQVLPVLPKDCIISDIASVKTGLKKFYEESGFRYVSTHPMFGPTFASLSNLNTENAIIISEGDHLGKIFFKDLYQTMKLNIFEYTFDEHDETVAYSLSIPFVSTFVFAAVMKHQEAPGTTFKKHMAIAKGLLSEDDYLLQEILFNPRTPSQVENIRLELKNLLEIINNKDAEGMKKYLTKIREKIK